jgi:hypothetical protein
LGSEYSRLPALEPGVWAGNSSSSPVIHHRFLCCATAIAAGVTLRAADMMAAKLPNAEKVLVEGAGHM